MAAHGNPLLRQIRRLLPQPAGQAQSDAALLRRFLHHKDEDAFAALIARHGPMVLGVCRRVLGNAHEAEDAAQASFVVLARKAATIRCPETLAAWLHRTAHHLALAVRRAGSRRLALEMRSYAPREPADPLEEISVRELLVILDEEVGRLPERYRLPVILCCLEDRTVEEAARQLGWSTGSLRGRLMRGRARLHARLVRRGVTLSAVPVVLGGLAPLSAPAGVPVGFTAAILRAAPPSSEGAAAPWVLALAEEGMKSMAAARVPTVLALVLLLGAAATGVGSLAYRGKATAQPAAEAARPQQAGATRPKARRDAFDTPLPEGAVARLGTLRWRHGGMTTAVQFAPDGKSLLTMGVDGLRVWDVDSGRCRNHLPNQEGRYLNPGILSADGKRVVSAEPYRKENRLRMWDVAGGRLLREFGDHPCIAGCFSPDGKVLATVGTVQPGDPRIRDFANVISLWDLATGERIRSWKAEHPVYCAAFTADGKTLITGDADRALRFWDVASGRHLRQLTGSARPIGHIVLSADGKRLAAIGLKTDPGGMLFPSGLAWHADNYLGLWDVAEGKEIRRFSVPTQKDRRPTGLVMAAFPPDGKTLLAVGLDSFTCCWDLATGKETLRLDVGGPVRAAALSPNGKTLAVLALSSIRLFDLPGGKERTPTGGHRNAVLFTLLTPDGQTAVTAEAGESDILGWDTAPGRERYRLFLSGRLLLDLQLAQDGRTLYAPYFDPSDSTSRGILVWDLVASTPIRRLPLHPLFKSSPLCCALSPDGKTLALAGRFGRAVYLMDSADGKKRRWIQAPEPGVSYLAFGPDSRSLVVVCYDGSVHTWDAARGGRLAQLPAWGYPLRRGQPALTGRDAVALSPDGKWLARVTPEGSPALMERATGNLAPLPNTPGRGVSHFAFSPDSRTLAWCGWLDSTIHLMEVASGQERRKLAGHGGAVEALAFSREGQLLISGSTDSTALVWGLFDRPGAALPDAELGRCWEDLASEQADRAYRAMQKLVRTPGQAVTELGKHLRPVAGADAAEVARLLADLGSDEYRVRQKATAALRQLGERADPMLREALEGEQTLEARRRVEALLEGIKARAMMPQSLRWVRAVEVLEQIGSPAAQQMLTSLAAGMRTARLTREARASLARLAERPRTKP
jgi:RNA polymerase sigma factor (sigma-70 family)